MAPNPSKAPWYFLGLQEMLVYFDPWAAGVVLPGLIIQIIAESDQGAFPGQVQRSCPADPDGCASYQDNTIFQLHRRINSLLGYITRLMTAFWTWSRFSASSNTTDRQPGPSVLSITSLLTS